MEEMTLQKLGEILNSMYFNSDDGEAVAMIHLFGIRYASVIQALRESKEEIAKEAGIPSWCLELPVEVAGRLIAQAWAHPQDTALAQ